MFTEKNSKTLSPIQYLGNESGNHLFVKREDLIPFSFGGNKARKAFLYFSQLEKEDCDCVVTYGSSSSNHCRVVCNMAAQKGLASYVISPQEAAEPTFNSQLLELFGTHVTTVPVDCVAETIDATLSQLRTDGKKPYFIAGGGHGDIGTQAFVDCYEEILHYEKECGLHFDYIFHATGTGTTQAGLVCGQLIHGDNRTITGISIARRLPRGRDVVLNSIHSYLQANYFHVEPTRIEAATIFDDSYIGAGYGAVNSQDAIHYAMQKYGLPLDATYTGKAFMGMLSYLQNLSDKNVLFIHTGGTPLYFDYLKNEAKG